ncbi:MAG: endosialidase [Lachnospiraceae bacterium]|nr:endosialidase [Lachnospiraceae bacterium]
MEIISTSENGKLSFGNYELAEKQKKEDFPHCGDLYKIKTYNTMTKLERNGLFLFESVPGTNVSDFEENDKGLFFNVESDKDAQITVGLEENTEYDIEIDGKSIGKIKSNGSGKVSFSIELQKGEVKNVKIVK